jgi:hypothetical protein
MNARLTIAIVGWMWIAFGVLAFISGAVCFLGAAFAGMPAKEFPVRSVPMDSLWRHYREGAALQAVLGPFVVYTAVMFQRRRNWARVVLQGLSVLMLIWIAWFSVFWFRVLEFITSREGPAAFLLLARVTMSIGGLVAAGTMACIFGLSLWALSRAGIREFCRDAQ